MTNLEFINLEIAITKSKYKEHLKFNQTAFAIKDEKRLKKLQQIKTDLEAWEVVKPTVVEDNIINKEVIKVKCTVYLKGESNGKYEKLKKSIGDE